MTTTTPAPERVYLEKVSQLRGLLQRADESYWQAADLILELAPVEGGKPALRRLAIDANMTESHASQLRSLAVAYPPELRKYKLPWHSYLLVMRQGELREKMLSRYEAAIAERPAKRAPSNHWLREIRDEVLAEAQIPQPARRTETDLLTRSINRWLARYNKGAIRVSTGDLEQLDSAIRQVAAITVGAGDSRGGSWSRRRKGSRTADAT